MEAERAGQPASGSDSSELIERARLGAERVREELEHATRELAQSWPRVPAEVLAEGRVRFAAALAAVTELQEKMRA